MEAHTALPPITIGSRDLARLEALLDTPALRQLPAAKALATEINRAHVLPPESLAADVVTMNSTVTCLDEVSGEQHRITLVYPQDADVATQRVSVLAPVGSALLGLSVGQCIDWTAPGGRRLRVRVKSVEHPPEPADDLRR